MTRTIFIAAALALAVTLPAVQAQAQAPRTFVSAAGSDTNPCSFALPCRHFQAAVDATSDGGEVDALDPAGYSPIVISRAITIEGQGWSYIAPPANGAAITINAVSGNVAIHGVSINGAGITGGTNGIVFNSGDSLVVENCVVRKMKSSGVNTGNGLYLASATSSEQALAVSDSYFTDNESNGILIQTQSSGIVRAAITRVGTYNGNTGLSLDGSSGTGAINVAATDSVATANGNGIMVKSASGHSMTKLMMTRVTAANNNALGVGATGTNATLRLGQSTVTGNGTTGYAAQNGGVIDSYGDNYIDDNGSNVGTLSPATRQ